MVTIERLRTHPPPSAGASLIPTPRRTPMHGSPIRASTTAFLLCSSLQLAASPIYRCAAPGGHITFSHHGCPAEQQQQLQNASPFPAAAQRPSQSHLQNVHLARCDRTTPGSQP
ncbi:DUF4124 domain-containing protein [Azorhizophilus paspali]|uniref:DUF4124 domain-containing protein n=1 Tax=Azorhizophilus paspali TaxID=69963 RepID=UPI003645C3C8